MTKTFSKFTLGQSLISYQSFWVSILLIMSLLCSQLYAQQATLQAQFVTTKTDTVKTRIATRLCQQFAESQPDSALVWAKRGLDVVQKQVFSEAELACLQCLSTAYGVHGQYGKSPEFIEKAITKAGGSAWLPSLYLLNGEQYFQAHQLENALQNLLKAIELGEKMSKPAVVSEAHFNICELYTIEGKHQDALHYAEKAIQQAGDNLLWQAKAYNAAGRALFHLGNPNKAKPYLEKVLLLHQKLGPTRHLAEAYVTLQNLSLSQNQPAKALEYSKNAENVFRKIPGGMGEVLVAKVHQGKLHTQLGDLVSAKHDFEQALSMLPMLEKQYAQFFKSTIYRNLGITYEALEDYKNALDYYKKFTALSDSLDQKKKQKNIAELETKYKVSEQEKELKIKDLENKNQQNFLIGSLIALVLLGGLAIALVRQNRFRKQAIEQISAEKQRADTLRERAEKSEAFKQQFLANMSHEIRTPMNAITGITNLLLTKKHDTETTNYHQIIKQSSDNLLVIINDILDLSKLEAGKMQLEQLPFSLQDTLRLVVETFSTKAHEKGISLQLNLPDTLPKAVLGDPTRLGQVLNNLVSNAIKFTEKGGLVEVKIFDVNSPEREKSSIHSSSHSLIHSLAFSISDTGIGIPPEKLGSIFESFVQANTSDSRRYGGTGLGLTISKNLVKLMGGDLQVSSEVGKGTTFSFELPFAQSDLPVQTVALHAGQVRLELAETIHILLAEDNLYNQVVAVDTLRWLSPKFQVEVAHNGRQVLEKLPRQPFDLVLMDVQMPEMDGYETTRRIRSDFSPDLPIIALTASVVRTDLDKCLAAGMNDYLPKPFQIQDFVKTLVKYLPSKIQQIEQSEVIEKQPITPIKNQLVNWDKMKQLAYGDEEYFEILKTNVREALTDGQQKLASLDDYQEVPHLVHSLRPMLLSAGIENQDDLHLLEFEPKHPDYTQTLEKFVSLLGKVVEELGNHK